ncbi:MAG: DDE-type integrase/transposase/recombinase, partial [Sweet potato little leaf phytoplasma]|nr:DDE-type integrase/transposase/recombinase [Sweet potato little leaf phytoplasma]
ETVPAILIHQSKEIFNFIKPGVDVIIIDEAHDRIFELIHCDIWGPYRSSTHSGHKYFLTIVDDFSRYTWLFLMKTKSEALTIIPRFFKYVETQYGVSIKKFRSDNAPELSFTDFFSSKGVVH